MKILFTIIISTFFSAGVFAQAGTLDSTFGTNGLVTTENFYAAIGIQSMALQPDGKIVAVTKTSYLGSWNNCFVARYNIDGTLDSSFGYGGIAYPYYSMNDALDKQYWVAMQQDGKIILASNVHDEVFRCNTDGFFDSTFNKNWSHQSVSYRALSIQSDGKILIAGDSDNGTNSILTLIRCDTSGALDNSFGTQGLTGISVGINYKCSSLAVQPDGKIIVAGLSYTLVDTTIALVRFNPDGSLDNTFDTDGIVTINLGIAVYPMPSVALQSNGKIVVAGISGFYPNTVFKMFRFNTDGSSDNSFGDNGIASSSIYKPSSIAIQSNDYIVVVGTYNSDFLVFRYDIDGHLDNTFGMVTTDFGSGDDASSVLIQADGKIIAGGGTSWKFALARYLPSLNVGIIDFSSSISSPLIYPNPVQQTENLEYTLVKEEILTLVLYDAKGNIAQTFFTNQKRIAGKHNEQLKSSKPLSAGNYFLSISNGSNNITVRLVKQ